MDKLAQQQSPLLADPINSDKLIMGVWNKYFAEMHTRLIAQLRAEFQSDPQLKDDLSKLFVGFAWPEFADMPTQNSLQQLMATLEKLRTVPRIQMNSEVYDAIQRYINQYEEVVNMIQQDKSKEPAKPVVPIAPKKPAQPSAKIKQLQQLLGVDQTGLWNPASNTAFLAWLKANGWEKYVSGNKFTGKLDDAIRAMLVEKAAPNKAQPATEVAMNERQAERLDRLKKL